MLGPRACYNRRHVIVTKGTDALQLLWNDLAVFGGSSALSKYGLDAEAVIWCSGCRHAACELLLPPAARKLLLPAGWQHAQQPPCVAKTNNEPEEERHHHRSSPVPKKPRLKSRRGRFMFGSCSGSSRGTW